MITTLLIALPIAVLVIALILVFALDWRTTA
jgi:hypothetical protein